MLQTLHRISVKKIDSRTGRLVLENSPWHPNKAHVDSFMELTLRGANVCKVISETIKLDLRGTAQVDVPVLTTKEDDLDQLLGMVF